MSVIFESSFRSRLLCVAALGGLSTPACGPSTPPTGSGGAVGSGGVVGSGGSTGTGATSTSGGAASTGGSVGAGGASGGSTSSGGGGSASGGQSSTGGAASGGGSGLTLVEPIERSASSYVLEFGDYLFEVDPTQGARIVTFSLTGTNLLYPVTLTADEPMWLTGGATFWLSPQAFWDWPPVEEIDRDPYTAMVTGSTIEVVSESAAVGTSTVFVEKSFTADLEAEAVDIVYEIHNAGAGAASFAPWEISRHARGGMTFWPGARAPDAGAQWEFEPTLVEGVYYWDDSVSAANDVKVSADGEQGWVAHVEGDLLFVKTWTPVPAADIALDQGEVELYLGAGFVEVEVQGPETEIGGNMSSSFAVRWYVRTLPVGTDVSVGSADLLAAVDAILP